MAYDEDLADRIRAALAERSDVIEKKMFGGIAFMVAGSMACGILGKDLMARVGPEGYEKALARPHARIMDFTGRPMRGFIRVEAAGIKTRASLQRWVDLTVENALALRHERKKTKKRKIIPERASVRTKPRARRRRAAK